MVRVEEVEKITDEVGGGGVDGLVHGAGLLERAESLGGEFGAVGVGAARNAYAGCRVFFSRSVSRMSSLETQRQTWT
jgi:hypothetical protein